ncbi:condensation domain-containing protein [Actinomadura keratinilytica]
MVPARPPHPAGRLRLQAGGASSGRHLHGAGRREEPPPAGFESADRLAAEEAAYLGSDRRQRDRAYWTERLAGLPEPVRLTDRTAPPGAPFLRRTAVLSPAETRALDEAAKAMGVARTDLLVAAVAAFLHRMTGADDLVLGLATMSRLGSAALRTPVRPRTSCRCGSRPRRTRRSACSSGRSRTACAGCAPTSATAVSRSAATSACWAVAAVCTGRSSTSSPSARTSPSADTPRPPTTSRAARSTTSRSRCGPARRRTPSGWPSTPTPTCTRRTDSPCSWNGSSRSCVNCGPARRICRWVRPRCCCPAKSLSAGTSPRRP